VINAKFEFSALFIFIFAKGLPSCVVRQTVVISETDVPFFQENVRFEEPDICNLRACMVKKKSRRSPQGAKNM
jgi:hypothetical protein